MHLATELWIKGGLSLLALVLIVFLVLGDDYPRLQHEFRPLLISMTIFLGMTIIADTIAISAVSIKRAMAKVKEFTPRGAHLSLETAIETNGGRRRARTYARSQLRRLSKPR